MAFQNIVFPDLKLKHGISKQVINPVTITGNGTREIRRQQNRVERYVWNINGRLLTEASKVAINNFLSGVKMGLDSFLFRDPTVPNLNVKLTYRSGTSWWFTVQKDTLGNAGTHPIFNRCTTDPYVVKLNGAVVSATVISIDTTNGQPYINVTGSNSGSNVTVTGSNYMTVRFEGTLNWTIAAMEAGTDCGSVTPTLVELGDFQLVEVFER